MTRPEPDFAETLARAVPDPPPLAGLAARAESGARRTRARRRTAVGAGVLALAAVAASLVIGSPPPPPVAQEVPSPTVVAAPCRTDAQEQAPGGVEATSIRFCPPEGRHQPPPALTPDVALVSDVDATLEAIAEGIQRDSERNVVCLASQNPSRIQVSYADGRVADLPVTACNGVFTTLLEAIGRQESAPVAHLDAPALTCPVTPAAITGRMRRDGDLVAVRSFVASDAVRCDYLSGRLRGSAVISDAAEAERLRADLLSSYSDALVDCGAGSDAPVTTWVLRLTDASIHTATVDGRTCGGLEIDRHYVGLAQGLLDKVATD